MPPTQLMQQYLDAKAQAPDAILLFRMGDFYELFYEDAERAARLLGLALTAREKGENAIPMAGFPHHALDSHLRKLIEAGERVAICDQMEDAAQAKGIIRRELTRVVTPGTITDEELLDPKTSNFLAAVAPATGNRLGLAWVDLASDRIQVTQGEPAEVWEELHVLEPAELLTPDAFDPTPHLLLLAKKPAWTTRRAASFEAARAAELLQKHFGVRTLGGFGLADDSPSAAAAGALLAYLHETQRGSLGHLTRIVVKNPASVVALDPNARRSLEITKTIREGKRAGSLLDAVDRTVTSAGARLLADWLNQPLLDPKAIAERHLAVDEWKSDAVGRGRLREKLGKSYDIQRLAVRLAAKRATPRDLAVLRNTLRLLPGIIAELSNRVASLNAVGGEQLDPLPELFSRLEHELAESPPHAARDGGTIRDGAHLELDDLREAARGGKNWLASYQVRQVERTGISNLKVSFNRVFGFYIEVPNSGRGRVPPDFERRQTIKNAERYITPELKEHERTVLGAEERVLQLEAELFRELREFAAGFVAELFKNAETLAMLDCLSGLAEIAAVRGFVRPTIVETDELVIEAGRHPVLEAMSQAGAVTPNDLKFDKSTGSGPRFLLVTGPNMAGKSTYIRQAALLAVLAQSGSFVPAAKATIGVVDRIFTRVGASDELSRGQSTFMVEMTETANLLRNATPRSLVVLDEIGRGTSTYDGVALAWAVAEHLHDRVGCRTLFATHYHELIDLEKSLPRLKNVSVAVREWREEILFLHQIVPGGADRSYGVHVARLAGVPAPVLDRAQQVLNALERDPFGERSGATDRSRPTKHRRQFYQLNLFPTERERIQEELNAADLGSIALEDALRLLRSLKTSASS